MRISVYYNLPFSGAKRTVFEHVKGLRSLGHVVDVYTLDKDHDIFDPGKIANNEYRYDYRKITIKVPFFKKITSDLSDFILLKKLHKRIAGHIDSRNYDIALIHTDKITQAPYILRYLKTKNVYFCLEPLKIGYEYGLRISDNFSFIHNIYETLNRSFRKKIDRENARFAHRSLAISCFGRELMIQAFDLYPEVSYLGVSVEKFKNIDISKKNQVLFIGQKIRINGYDLARDAIKLIPKKNRPKLKVLSILDNNSKRFSDDEIINLYNESLITLSLSNFDTFGLVALEAMACEVPVIALNVAGYRETVINGKTGYLVDFDPRRIAEKIKYLIAHPKKIKQMGKDGRIWTEKKWTWNQQILILEKILKDSVSR